MSEKKNNLFGFNIKKPVVERKETRGRKPKELHPLMEPHNELSPALKDLANAMKNNSVMDSRQEDDTSMSDNFFRIAVNNLMNDKDIELKTEYLNVNENFAGAKLTFLSKYANMPKLKDFVTILERKRVSLGRKSRIELIKIFDKRDEEIQAQERIRDFKTIMGM